MEPHLRSPICFHGVFKGRVPYYYGLESLAFTPPKKGVEQGYDRRGPLFHCTRHWRWSYFTYSRLSGSGPKNIFQFKVILFEVPAGSERFGISG